MNIPLIVFCSGFIIFGTLAWLLRGVIASLSAIAAEHTRIYAISYVKCCSLVAISMGATFIETFWSLSKEEVAAWAWWTWVIALWKPLAAGLATLIAFLDRSAQTATAKKKADEANGTQSPFAALTTGKPSPTPTP